jgi:hypothetical protein
MQDWIGLLLDDLRVPRWLRKPRCVGKWF